MSVSLLEMLENLSYNTRLGDEADHSELASAALTKERVDFVHPTDKIPPTYVEARPCGRGLGISQLHFRLWHYRLTFGTTLAVQGKAASSWSTTAMSHGHLVLAPKRFQSCGDDSPNAAVGDPRDPCSGASDAELSS